MQGAEFGRGEASGGALPSVGEATDDFASKQNRVPGGSFSVAGVVEIFFDSSSRALRNTPFRPNFIDTRVSRGIIAFTLRAQRKGEPAVNHDRGRKTEEKLNSEA